MKLSDIQNRVERFKRDAHGLFSKYETSPSRVVDLTNTYQQLKGLSIQQDDLFRQSIRCAEQQLYRASHVMAWAAFMDFLEVKIASKGFPALHIAYPSWSACKTVEDLRENVVEFQLVEAAQKLNLCSKTQKKALHGLLNKRNECAHPSDFYPELNETLGYISEVFQRIAQIQPK
jgi:flagellar biosynthesis chaperone FliJ